MLEYIIAATILVSLASLAGIVTLLLNERRAQWILFVLVSFAAGTLLGAAFLDLLPEAIEEVEVQAASFAALAGVLVFFVIEKIIHWHHHHDTHKRAPNAKAKPRPLGYLNLLGDGLHNFFDGAAIAASFMAGTPTGIATTAAVLLHEIPQEIGDFTLLIYSGFSRTSAILFNFLSAILAVIGALAFYYFSSSVADLKGAALGFTAGMFIYIAAADLVPELHKERDPSKSLQQLALIILGIFAIWLIATYIEA